jgi:DNA-binding beta-propeller fold protein YncE
MHLKKREKLEPRSHNKQVRRALALTAVSGLLTVSVAGGAAAGVAATMDHGPGGTTPLSKTADFNPPVAFGPRPATFTIGDGWGTWFDTGMSIAGTHSLAVAELPTADPAEVTGSGATTTAGRIVGGGFLTGKAADAVLNPIPGLAKLNPTGKTLGQLGIDADKLLNLGRTRSYVHQLLPANDPRIAKVDQLTHAFAKEMANVRADQPYVLANSPSGAPMYKLLKQIRADYPSTLPVTVNFDVGMPMTDQAHTASALVWPAGAPGMPFDQAGAWKGSRTVQLSKPGLYAFGCKVHPYMLGAVVVLDPLVPGGDFGPKLQIKSRGMNVPSSADIVFQLVNKFFIITNPENWEHYSDTQDTKWDPSFAPAPVMTWGASGPELIPDLDMYMKNKFHFPKTLAKAGQTPSTPGVGEVWFDTQMEKYAGKDKSGAATKLNAETWKIERKIAAPEIDMNNPHNMWTDKDEKYLYQTEWFSHWLDVFDKSSGKLIRRFDVGPSPTHVMTRPDNDMLHVALGGGGAVMELQPGATGVSRRLAVGSPDEPIAHPHAHWMSGNSKWMATPNVNLYNASIVDIKKGTFRHEQTGEFPIATGGDAASSKFYMADFLGATLSCISTEGPACTADDGTKVHYKKVDLWNNYDPIKGATGDWGGLPIQIAVAPDNSGGLMANTLTSTITVFDPKTDKLVASLPCDSGCHGINFGAKKGGGYYAYVTSKFANVIDVVDINPSGDGNPADAKIVGKLLTEATSDTQTDDTVVQYAGMGGQGVIPIPIAYEGWVEHAPKNAINDELTFAKSCK